MAGYVETASSPLPAPKPPTTQPWKSSSSMTTTSTLSPLLLHHHPCSWGAGMVLGIPAISHKGHHRPVNSTVLLCYR